MQKTVQIEGMMCQHCAGAVQKALEAVDGVSQVVVDLEQKHALVTCTEATKEATLSDAVTKAGYTVVAVQ